MNAIEKELDYAIRVVTLGGYDAREAGAVIETMHKAKKELEAARTAMQDFTAQKRLIATLKVKLEEEGITQLENACMRVNKENEELSAENRALKVRIAKLENLCYEQLSNVPLAEYNAVAAQLQTTQDLLKAAKWHLDHPFSSSAIEKLGLTSRIEEFLAAFAKNHSDGSVQRREDTKPLFSSVVMAILPGSDPT